MATRVATRYVPRRLMSKGRVLGDEEKAAENVYIKKIEQEKMEKLARKGPKPEDKPPTANDVKTKASHPASSTFGVSTDKYRNLAVAAALVTGLGSLGWYLSSSKKKTEEVHA